ncbi:MAG: hypothetical protein LBK96_02790 [Prevotellaceae bacterium]|jgi:hypothetical protein|nr:hypothetical protein [Prevotellaceae bacterium]
MIFDNIRRKVFRILLFALLILLLLYFKDLFFDVPGTAEWKHSAFKEFSNVFHGRLSLLISMALTLASGLLIYKLSYDNLSFTGREHLLIWLWVIQAGAFSFLHPLSGIHFATVFILLSYGALFSTYRKTSDNEGIFLSAMYLGIAGLFYDCSIYLFIPYIIALYRFKIVKFRDWIISIAGFLVPFYFSIFIFHFFTGDWLYPIESTINGVIPDDLSLRIAEMSVAQYIFCILIFVLIVTEMLMPAKSRGSGINQKTISCLRSFSVLMCASVLIFLLFAPESKLILQIIIIYTTVRLRILFIKINKNIIANSLFLLLIVASVITAIL